MTRTRAMMVLEEEDVREAVDVMLLLLTSDDEEVRHAAVVALGKLGDDRTAEVGPAIERLLADQDWSVRNQAAGALGNLRYIPARPALERMMRDDQEWVARAAAAEALGELGDARALATLRAAIDDETAPVRAYVAMAIGQLGGKAELPVLQRRLAIEAHPVARAALLELALRLGDEAAFDNLLAFARGVESDFAYEPLNLINDLLSRETPAVVVTRAAELEPVLAALSQRTGGGDFALEVRARLAALVQAPAPGK